VSRPSLVTCLIAGLVAAGCGARSDVASDSALLAVEDSCNGIDDDLDGFVDEDAKTVECGAGACRAKGACVDGAIRCEPKPPAQEICSGEVSAELLVDVAES